MIMKYIYPDFIAAAEAAGIYYTSCDITCWQLSNTIMLATDCCLLVRLFAGNVTGDVDELSTANHFIKLSRSPGQITQRQQHKSHNR